MRTYTGAYTPIGKYLDSIINETFDNTADPDIAEQFILDTDDFFYELHKSGLLNAQNAQTIVDRVKSIKYMTALPNGSGIFGRTNDDNIEVNTDLDRFRQKLYTFHELAHAVAGSNTYDKEIESTVQNFCKNNLQGGNKEALYNQIGMNKADTDFCAQYGWQVLDEWFAQELAERLCYSSVQAQNPDQVIRRPLLSTQKDPSGTGHKAIGDLTFQSNFDYYGLYQPLALGFGKTIRGIGGNPRTNESISKDMLKAYIDKGANGFIKYAISEYQNDERQHNLGQTKALAGIFTSFGTVFFSKLKSFSSEVEAPNLSERHGENAYLCSQTYLEMMEDKRATRENERTM